jgi:cytoskeletal protein CcmA (bactofilin family)
MSILARNSRPPVAPAPPAAGDHGAVNALLGKGSSFEGKLVFEGTVHVNGEFKGEIRSDDTLVVGEGAHVEGEIHVGTAIVTGEVVGTIHATEVVELRAPARVRGTIVTPALVVERGVLVDGSTRMADRDVKNSK